MTVLYMFYMRESNHSNIEYNCYYKDSACGLMKISKKNS